MKRSREEVVDIEKEESKVDEEDKDEKEEPIIIENDSFQAISLLLSEFSKNMAKNKSELAFPICLLSQVYTILHVDRSEVDKQVDDLKERKLIKLLNIPDSNTDIIIFRSKDLVSYIEKISQKQKEIEEADKIKNNSKIKKQKLESDSTKEDKKIKDSLILSSFSSYISSMKGTLLSKEMICTMLNVKVFLPNLIHVLYDQGLLVSLSHGYSLSIPGISTLTYFVLEGRNEALSIIRKNKYHEILQHVFITNKSLKKSNLGSLFHLRDIVGRGDCLKLPSASGDLLRLKI